MAGKDAGTDAGWRTILFCTGHRHLLPFLVDLLAENERIDEENRIRLREETRRQKKLERRKNKVKNEIILKALAEASDLEALRAEKRMIAMEERRLKALLDLERAKTKNKQDLMAAHRAEKQRKHIQHEFRRKKREAYELEFRRQQKLLLRDKLGIPEPNEADGTFGSRGD